MPSLRAVTLSLVAASCLTLTVAVESTQDPQAEVQNGSDEVKVLINAVPDQDLHKAIHQIEPAFEDGIFDSDASAVEALASEDPDAASRLASMAHFDLAKRQADNSSIASASPTTTAITTTETTVSTTPSSSTFIVSPNSPTNPPSTTSAVSTPSSTPSSSQLPTSSEPSSSPSTQPTSTQLPTSTQPLTYTQPPTSSQQPTSISPAVVTTPSSSPAPSSLPGSDDQATAESFSSVTSPPFPTFSSATVSETFQATSSAPAVSSPDAISGTLTAPPSSSAGISIPSSSPNAVLSSSGPRDFSAAGSTSSATAISVASSLASSPPSVGTGASPTGSVTSSLSLSNVATTGQSVGSAVFLTGTTPGILTPSAPSPSRFSATPTTGAVTSIPAGSSSVQELGTAAGTGSSSLSIALSSGADISSQSSPALVTSFASSQSVTLIPFPSASSTAQVIGSSLQAQSSDTVLASSSSVAPVAPVSSAVVSSAASSSIIFSVVPSTGDVVQPFTTSNSAGMALTTVTSIPVASITTGPIVSGTENIIETTDQYGETVTLRGATDGAVITTTDAAGHTLTTTYHPGGQPVRSIAVITSTLSDGQRQTLTSVAVVVPTVVASGENNQAKTSAPIVGQPALVTGNVAVQSRKLGREAIALVAGAAGVAALL